MENLSTKQKSSTASVFLSALLPTLYDVIETVAITASIVLLAFTFIFKITVVDGSSMNQTLQNGDVLIISDICYEPKYGDIVVFSLEDKNGVLKKYVKRVIATEGQTIAIDLASRTVTVDGKMLDESDYAYFEGNFSPVSDHEYPITVPDGCVFVMGDNRNHSLDSRFDQIGFVDTNLIFGKVIARIYPFESFGMLSSVADNSYGD